MGLSVASHAGVLARSKISGSLLHRLSRPWHGLGPGGSHRDQRYGAAPKFSSPAEGDGSSSCLAIAASASSSSDFRCCSFILERRLAKQFSHDTKLLKLNQMRDGEGVKPVCARPFFRVNLDFFAGIPPGFTELALCRLSSWPPTIQRL